MQGSKQRLHTKAHTNQGFTPRHTRMLWRMALLQPEAHSNARAQHRAHGQDVAHGTAGFNKRRTALNDSVRGTKACSGAQHCRPHHEAHSNARYAQHLKVQLQASCDAQHWMVHSKSHRYVAVCAQMAHTLSLIRYTICNVW